MQVSKPIIQEVVEVASIDENGILSQPIQAKEVITTDQSLSPFDTTFEDHVFESTIRITMPSGIRVELSNNTNAATIKSVLDALQSV
jgi:hypothetical protein